MNINTNNLVSITEANQNFSKVARLVDENGYTEKEQFASVEDVMSISKRLIAKNKQAYTAIAVAYDIMVG